VEGGREGGGREEGREGGREGGGRKGGRGGGREGGGRRREGGREGGRREGGRKEGGFPPEHSSASDFPDPVGDSSSAFSPFSAAFKTRDITPCAATRRGRVSMWFLFFHVLACTSRRRRAAATTSAPADPAAAAAAAAESRARFR